MAVLIIFLMQYSFVCLDRGRKDAVAVEAEVEVRAEVEAEAAVESQKEGKVSLYRTTPSAT